VLAAIEALARLAASGQTAIPDRAGHSKETSAAKTNSSDPQLGHASSVSRYAMPFLADQSRVTRAGVLKR